MSHRQDRYVHEQIATSVEWALDQPAETGFLASHPYLAPEAARVVLAQFDDQYEGLIGWLEAARVAANAAAAVEVAKATKAHRSVIRVLEEKAEKAHVALAAHELPDADDPVEVLRSFAALHRIAAGSPEDYETS